MVVELLMIWIVNFSLHSDKNILKMEFLMLINMYSLETIQKINLPLNTKCLPTQVFNLTIIMFILLLFLKMIHRKFSDLMPMLT